MGDPVFDIIDEIFDDMGIFKDPRDFEKQLAEYGFMIVPIDDPTNLRYGVEDE
jgi:protein-L-isoaspartate O-methyltransferase